MNSPLRVLLICDGPSVDSAPFVLPLRKTFLATDAISSFTASDYELLNPADFRVFLWSGAEKDPNRTSSIPDTTKKEIAAHSEAVLVILLLAVDDELAHDLLSKWAAIAKKNTHLFVLAISLAMSKAPPLPDDAVSESIMCLGLDDLDERDLRCDFVSLHALNCSLKLLSRVSAESEARDGTSSHRGHPTLFFSHAKRDGVPLSTSIVSWIDRLKTFRFFYDTRNLDLKGDIGAQLEQAVSNSVLVVLRTEVFDQRYWCQKEVFWAEKHGVPVISVDARWNLQHAPSVMAFDSSPSVRIPDGSLVRILIAALSEALRVACFRARVRLTAQGVGLTKSSWTALPRFPSLILLHSAKETKRKATQQQQEPPPCFFIVHANPTMPDDIRDVPSEVAAALIPESRVLSLDEFRVHCYALKP
jgi:hypothetical protein